MSSRSVPRLFTRLVDDAAVFPPGNAPLAEALTAHHRHRGSWYADLVGPLLLPTSAAGDLGGSAHGLTVGLIADTGLAGLDTALTGPAEVRQVEIAVAKRGEDPLPGLRAVTAWAEDKPFDVYAEIPLTWGCIAALDHLAEVGGVHPKFRTGGLAAELFPSPEDLAAVIVACAQRGLRFKLTAGLHHAVRHHDSTTGFTHHGFLNVLVAAAEAALGGDAVTVAKVLELTTPGPLVVAARERLDADRPLWVGFGSCSIHEPLDDLVSLDLIPEEIPR